MKKKTKIIIGCAVLALVIIAAAITGIKITDLQRQNTFVDQVNKLSQIVDAEYISDIDRDEFNTFIDSRVCKGKYAKLENAVKSYYKDLYEIQFKSEDAITNSAYDKMLLSDNLISDGPDLKIHAPSLQRCFKRCKTALRNTASLSRRKRQNHILTKPSFPQNTKRFLTIPFPLPQAKPKIFI